MRSAPTRKIELGTYQCLLHNFNPSTPIEYYTYIASERFYDRDMFGVLNIFLFVFLKAVHCKQLAVCNDGSVETLQLCTFDTEYDNGVPVYKPGSPDTLITKLTVYKIAELDENKNTITINFVLSVIWKDTRLTLESNNPNR